MYLSTVVMTVMMWLLLLNNQPQNRSADPPLLLEKQAVAGARQTLASVLDANLPKISFSDWFESVVGRKAGMVWQLSECGDTTSNAARDAPACVEVNTLLPDSRRVIVMIIVGTFKKGIAGQPAFHYGVVEEQGKLRPIKRLGDLQKLLSAPGQFVESPQVVLPELKGLSVRIGANNAYLSVAAPWNNVEEIGRLTQIEEPPPEPPTNRPQSPPPSPNQPQSIQQVIEQVLTGNAITRVQPVYPPQARMMNAMGEVKVQITVSETGSVIEAKAISGHKALYRPAVEAAYKWTFKPTTTSDGTPIKVQGVLTFNFRSSP
jgi:TonB family protein